MPKKVMKVRITRNLIDYIHNDLANSARYFSQRVTDREATGERDGIFFEIISGLTMCAFTAEANYNFVGWKLGIKWGKNANYHDKRKAVFEHLKIETKDERPFSTLLELHKFRSTLAHGKPREEVTNEERTGTHDELYEMMHSRPSWEATANAEFLRRSYDDVRAVWEMMVKAGGIKLMETVGGSGAGMELIEIVSEGDD